MNNIFLLLFLQLVAFIFQRPSLDSIPGAGTIICSPNEHNSTSRIFIFAMIIVEFIIDVYVTVRLYQILRKANRNAAQISNMGVKTKRTLFTAVIYWNFLRLVVSVVFHISPLWNLINDNEVRIITSQSVINIILSYTVDAEIVRVIEGRDKKKKGSSTDSDKSKSVSKSSPATSATLWWLYA